MARLAKTSHDQGKHEQAEALFREVFSRRPESWSDDDWDKILADFADTLAKQGKDDEAAGISRQRLHSEASESDTSEMSAE